jgi:NAD(P)-dependent dehydrogenase (short-subunit alcohol dehydrogenase family)
MGRQDLEQRPPEDTKAWLDMSAMGRLGTAEDIASAVEWLASPAASLITGCDLRIDGGMVAAMHCIDT